ncbi:AAA family ATPase [Roseateles saccharophilus]|uniref:SpoVK/Ycf46/Vps4 family AAA+-type ATPase n=1 Tax=Roseateles saccharophilus TaxID=304 RepID=A0A4R3UHG1_ROSSA|nr:AAA family ATPase [Roseateles saccharophilus]MDG0834845.1 AAA family ATPase [Roseateles saccharophilus]TCU88379.1 SpoVK/Ycf46/Vps4 family AAA+-type ATPase [Roseateles saccharophilus]
MKACASCAGANRPGAKFCKFCGTGLAAPTAAQTLASLVGLDNLRAALDAIRLEAEGRRRSGRDPRRALALLIIGDSGTAKSQLGPMLASVLHDLQLVARVQPVVVNGLQQDDLDSQKLAAAFSKAKGSVLFVDNAQLLLSPQGEPQAPFNQLMHLMEGSPLDPVVVMAGLPSGLEAFCQRAASRNLLGRFSHVFRIADYLPEQLAQICANALLGNSFSLPDDTRGQLLMRMRWLYRRLKSGGPDIRAVNGRLALDEAAEIERRYYTRGGSDNVLLPEDMGKDVDRVKSIEEIMAAVDDLIGMGSIKTEMRTLHRDIENNRLRASLGLAGDEDDKLAYHFILTGNPGTGKTTVARKLGEVFEALGVLPTGHVVEVDRSKLVGEYQGHTATKVVAACKQAEGGVLFVDEAYALVQGNNDSFGREAVDTLLKRMEDDRGKYVVIAAGYDGEMQEFVRTNPGLKSRFKRTYHLDDYTPDELTEIFNVQAAAKRYTLGAGTRERVLAFFAARCARKTGDFANGREARNLFDDVRSAQSGRLSRQGRAPDAGEMVVLLPEDVPGVATGSPQTLAAALGELQALTGLQEVKDAVSRLAATLNRERVLGSNKPLERHFLFLGGPGTGKTTVAKLMGRVFHGLGMLPTDRVVEVTRTDLVAGYVGQTAKLTDQFIDKAMGGVLFIDEAYGLLPRGAQGDFGIEAVNTLLKRMEDDRGKFVVVAAGYHREMKEFLDSNSGLKDRFSDTINFTDYGPSELQQIFISMCDAEGCQRAPGFDDVLSERLRALHAARTVNFGNARAVRRLFNDVKSACGERVTALQLSEAEQPAAMRLFTPADLQQRDPA